MPRYFFHLQSENVVVPDTKGKDFDCMQDAHFHAQMIVRGALPYLDEDEGRWSVRIQASPNEPEVIVLFPNNRRLLTVDRLAR
jgi:hypothetical protein